MIALPVAICFLLSSLHSATAMSTGDVPRVIVVGAGAAGVAAASRLIENGITDVVILEAEDRIGGRIHTTKIGTNLVDMGAQWVHGEGNPVFELAYPLGLLAKFDESRDDNQAFYLSSGTAVPKEAEKVMNYFYEIAAEEEEGDFSAKDLKTGSFGEYIDKKFEEFFNNHTDISEDMRDSLLRLVHHTEMGLEGTDSDYDLSAKSMWTYIGSEGDQGINWKDRGYGMIFDILTKKYPNPEEELPVMIKTKLNKRVSKIKYGDGSVTVTTTDGDTYKADHLVCTVSLGVLQAEHTDLFEPHLPETNRNSIENLGIGHNAKIFLYYDEPWWSDEDARVSSLVWTKEDIEELENDPERKWMLSAYEVLKVESKPRSLCIWLSGKNVTEMELTGEELFREQVVSLLEKFFGKLYNLTEPQEIKRTIWNSNKNFLGTWSYRRIQSDTSNASAEDLGSPVVINGKPVILFAGEATDPKDYSTVQGAIASGWREADRLICYIKKQH